MITHLYQIPISYYRSIAACDLDNIFTDYPFLLISLKYNILTISGFDNFQLRFSFILFYRTQYKYNILAPKLALDIMLLIIFYFLCTYLV